MYQHEHSAFKDAVYRPGLCDDLWRELDALIIDQPETALCE